MSIPPAIGWIVALAGLLTLTLLCWLPYHVSVAPTFSDSYLFGYSNRTALVLVGIFAVSVAVLAARTGRLQKIATPGEPMAGKTLSRALWFTVALALPLHIIVRRTGGYIESPYFLDRIKLVLDGRVPYRDFEFAYGASFLYVPAWLARAFHLSAADAYGLVWLAVNLLGIWMLFCTVQQLPASLSAKRGIFFFFFAMAMLGLLCTGVNYSMFRFILPPYFALLLQRRLQADRQVIAILLTAPCFLALLLISPELALTFALGMAAYFAVFARIRVRTHLAAYLFLLALLALLTWSASVLGVFITLDAFRSGGFNFPVMPAAPILFFLVAVALTSAYAGISLSARQGSPLMVLIAVSAGTGAGALGRCDPGHVLFNPVGIWIAALVLASARPPLGRLALQGCAFIFFLLPMALNVRPTLVTPAHAAMMTFFAMEGSHPLPELESLVLRVADRLYGTPKARLKIEEARRFAALHDDMDVGSVYGFPSGTILEAPFQFAPEQFGPVHSRQIDTGYFYAMVNLVTPQEVERKVAELAGHGDRPLLLPAGAEGSCGVSPEASRAVIRGLFLYPYAAPARHMDSILEPICRFIRDHYTLTQPATPDRLNYAVWERRGTSPSEPDARRSLPRVHP